MKSKALDFVIVAMAILLLAVKFFAGVAEKAAEWIYPYLKKYCKKYGEYVLGVSLMLGIFYTVAVLITFVATKIFGMEVPL